MTRKTHVEETGRFGEGSGSASLLSETTRRDFGLHILGGLTAVALTGACGDAGDADAGGYAGAGSGGTGTGGTGGGTTSGSGTGAGGAGGGNGCTVYPQQTEGPYYLDLGMLRRDITEGKPGAPLRIVIEVLSATACAPLKDVAVDLWQCDADGVYSGYPNMLGGLDTTGQTFLRGTQVTDENGLVEFDSIYPGWYPGRTTHIHFKVHPTSTTEATSQMYFPEDVTMTIYATAPYSTHGPKDTSNAADLIAQTGGIPPLADVTGDATGYVATITVSVAG